MHRGIRVLESIRWRPQVRERFFADDARELPEVSYTPLDPGPAREAIAVARTKFTGRTVVDAWLRGSADVLETTAEMLARVGTRDLSRHAQTLYGRPNDLFPNTDRTPLSLAKRIIRTTERAHARLPDPPPPNIPAGEAAEEIRIAVRAHFGPAAPEVTVVPGLTARAAAAPKRIRLRRGALFSDLDVRQLIQHEAFVHVATALNGKRQRAMPLLAANHAGTTRMQEGLAVFAELISGTLDTHRLLRIAHRVIAIDMAMEGADFLEVYRYFLRHSTDRIEAYESAARVFRGGVLTGGAPFTKDLVYLDGLVRMHVFVRAAVITARIDCLRLLFAGKFDLADLPVIAQLRRDGVCRGPRFVPPWVSDPRRLVAYFAATDVIGRTATAGLREHYMHQLRDTPEPPAP